jgi:hypothetical protein
MKNRVNNLWFHNTNQNVSEDLTNVHQHNIDTYSS